MSTVAHRHSRVQVGNGVECETARPRRTLRHELSAEQYSDHDLDLNKDTYGTREMGKFISDLNHPDSWTYSCHPS